MSRRKYTKDHIRNIQQSKGSYYISIPMSLMRELGWQERQRVMVKKHGKSKILISDWQKGKG